MQLTAKFLVSLLPAIYIISFITVFLVIQPVIVKAEFIIWENSFQLGSLTVLQAVAYIFFVASSGLMFCLSIMYCFVQAMEKTMPKITVAFKNKRLSTVPVKAESMSYPLELRKTFGAVWNQVTIDALRVGSTLIVLSMLIFVVFHIYVTIQTPIIGFDTDFQILTRIVPLANTITLLFGVGLIIYWKKRRKILN